MRLWHYKLIPALPRQQLIAQWRECCCIAKNIADKGTPNHLLVNKVLEYSVNNFTRYTHMVATELIKRGYRVSQVSWENFNDNIKNGTIYFDVKCAEDGFFDDWHTPRYFKQCYYNLQEKYDCGGITDEEWVKIENVYEKDVFADGN